MAKKSKIIRNDQRRATAAKYAQVRGELKAILANTNSDEAQRAAARAKLSSLPRDASPTRIRNRDAVDGRPRGYIGKAGLSRVRFRELAHRGELPGISKSSW